MTTYYYKTGPKRKKSILKLVALGIILCGLGIASYVFFPLISWQVYFAPVFAEQNIAAPIPRITVVKSSTVQSLINEATQTIRGVDYVNAQNWFPDFVPPTGGEKLTSNSSGYNLSIPKLGIKNAIVSTTDYDLSNHLVNYIGTAIPPENGNAVIIGHSTLPQLFNPNDYKTIFAKAYTLGMGDEIFAQINNISYRYAIINIKVVDPTDTSVFAQSNDASYLTLVTCTPPGTTWKRLIIKAKLVPIQAS